MYTTNKSRQSRNGARVSSHRPQSRAQNGQGGFRSSRNSGRPSGGRASGGRGGGGGRRGGRVMSTFNPSRFINTNPVELAPEVFIPVNTFETFGLTDKLVENIKALGITIPSPIQDQVIPEVLKDRDVIGLAETGTGKTAAFLVPLIEKTLAEKNRQTLILAPTRELALQIESEFHKLARGFSLFSVVCVGGVSIQPQMKTLRYKNHFVIGTPGRIKDLIERRSFNPAGVTTVVLDEADRMLDMGFIHDITSIVGMTPDDRETLLFSATMHEEAKRLVHKFLKNPVPISVKKKDVTNSIEQDVVHFKEDSKFETLASLLRKPEFKRVLIFCSMKHGAERLAKELARSEMRAESIHGNKNHTQRQRALNDFKAGKAQILVATNVAARGIHVDDVSHVINYDLPQNFEDYVHRIGRTGRGNNRGKALTFIPAHQARY